jgi:hypothetical protein
MSRKAKIEEREGKKDSLGTFHKHSLFDESLVQKPESHMDDDIEHGYRSKMPIASVSRSRGGWIGVQWPW